MSVLLVYTLLCLAVAAGVATGTAKPYRVGDIGGVGRRFDGFGGLSGGGVSGSMLLWICSLLYALYPSSMYGVCTSKCRIHF